MAASNFGVKEKEPGGNPGWGEVLLLLLFWLACK